METLSHADRWQGFLKNCGGLAGVSSPFQVSGSLTRVTGLIMEATGLKLAVGSGCTILMPNGNSMEAEVVGFHGDRLYLMPAHGMFGLAPGAKVVPWDRTGVLSNPVSGSRQRRRASDQISRFPVGEALLGRVVDGTGRPLDDLGPLEVERSAPLASSPINPLDREPPVGQVVDRRLGVTVGGERRDRSSRLRGDRPAAVHPRRACLFRHCEPPLPLDAPTGWGWPCWAAIWTRRGLAFSATGIVIVSTPRS